MRRSEEGRLLVGFKEFDSGRAGFFQQGLKPSQPSEVLHIADQDSEDSPRITLCYFIV